MGERYVRNVQAGGSIPPISTKETSLRPTVGGSRPWRTGQVGATDTLLDNLEIKTPEAI